MVRFLIYGAGAIGSFMAYLLAGPVGDSPVEEVALLGRPASIHAVREAGLKVTLSQFDTRILHFRHCFSDIQELISSGFRPDLVVICVKTYSLPEVGREIRNSGLLKNLQHPTPEIILLMNGMGNRESLRLGDKARVFEGITAMGVELSGPGQVTLRGVGPTYIQPGVGEEGVQALRERLSGKGFPVDFPPDFPSRQWQKLIANSVINPVTALTRQKNGILLSPHLEGTLRDMIQECVAVARAEGIDLEDGEMVEMVKNVASMTAMNTSSMLQDVLRGGRTEMEAINGYLIRQAHRHGLQVPLNEILYGMVRSMEK